MSVKNFIESLSEREIQLMKMLVNGRTQKSCAQELETSPSRIAQVRNGILRKARRLMPKPEGGPYQWNIEQVFAEVSNPPDPEKPKYGKCFFCGKEKLDCIDFAINQTGSATVDACHACRWGRQDLSKGKVYGRQTGQPDTCRVIVELCHPNAKLPWQASPGDACYDLFATEDVTIDYGETRVIKLGLKIQLEPGWEAQIRGRSSLQAAGLLFTVGTIDERYRKEIGAIVTSLHDGDPVYAMVEPVDDESEWPVVVVSRNPYRITAGERIAQMAIRRAPAVQLVAGVVEPTERGGFGSTGR